MTLVFATVENPLCSGNIIFYFFVESREKIAMGFYQWVQIKTEYLSCTKKKNCLYTAFKSSFCLPKNRRKKTHTHKNSKGNTFNCLIYDPRILWYSFKRTLWWKKFAELTQETCKTLQKVRKK